MSQHIDDDLASRYAAGVVDDRERAAIVTHLGGCDLCRELVAALARDDRPPGPDAATARDDRPPGPDAATARDDGAAESGPDDPLSGVTIGRYQLGARLGAGAMGVVYRARDPVLEREVAIKLVRNLDEPALRAQLVAAARALAKIEHPNVLPVYDAGEDGGEVFVASALADGGDLRAAVAGQKPRDLLPRFAELAEGLAAVHAAGLVHRDVKPDNVLVGDGGRLLLADIGYGGSGSSGAQTPAYLAPELRAGAPASAATDQYALAVTLCEVITGARPRGPGDAAARLRRAGASARAIRAVSRALAPIPSRRHASAAAFAAALRPRSRVRSAAVFAVAAAVVAALAVQRPAAPPCAVAAGELSWRWQVRRPALAARFGDHASLWRPLDAHLSRYVSDLGRAAAGQCAAAGRGDDGAHARLACLSQRTSAVDGLLSALALIEPDALPRGPSAASLLATTSSCERGTPLVAPPPAPAVAAHAMALEREIDTARALGHFGDLDAAERGASAALEAAADLEADAVIAEARAVLGGIAASRGDDGAARDHFERAADAAERSGHDALRAEALVAVLALPGTPLDDGLAIARRVEAIVERTGDRELEALALQRRGIFLAYQGRLDDAVADFEAALRLRRELHGDDSHWITAVEGNLASAYLMQGRREAAEPLFRRVLAAQRQLSGADHPLVARALGNLSSVVAEAEALSLLEEAVQIFRSHFGDASPDTVRALTNSCAMLTDAGRDGAVARCQEAVTAAEALYGAEHPALAWPLTALGRGLLEAERPDEARAALERGLAVAADPPRYPMELADLRYYLAAALVELGRDRERALALARSARREWATAPSRQSGLAELDQLIAELERRRKR